MNEYPAMRLEDEFNVHLGLTNQRLDNRFTVRWRMETKREMVLRLVIKREDGKQEL